jgi:hypothetical protein
MKDEKEMTSGLDFAPGEIDRIENAFLVGLGRQPLPPVGLLPARSEMPASMQALAVLALLGQRRRYVRPGPFVPAVQPRRLPEDALPVLPDPLRRALLRLAVPFDKEPAVILAAAALGHVARSPFRLHPFDLPRLLPVLKRHRDGLRPSERACLAVLAPAAEPAADPFAAEIGMGNWTEFPRASRIAFITALRWTAPGEARALIEAGFAGETAALRADLVKALRTGLSLEDRPFLDSLAADRAQSVRDAAQDLLALLPGSDAYARRIDRAVTALAVKTDGLLRRRSRVVLSEEKAGPAELVALFSGLTLDSVAARLGLAVEELVAAAFGAETKAVTSLLLLAAAGGDAESFAILTGYLSALSWAEVTEILVPAIEPVGTLSPLPLARLLSRHLGLPVLEGPFPAAVSWTRLGRILGGTLPASWCQTIWQSEWWAAFKAEIEGGKTPRRFSADADFCAFAALIPASLGMRLAAEARTMPAKSHYAIQVFGELLDFFEKTSPTE